MTDSQNEENVPIPPRPGIEDASVRELVLDRVFKKVLVWYQSAHGKVDAKETEELREDISNVIFLNLNGYQMAKELDERYGWCEIDSYLVSVLDDCDFVSEAAIRELTLQWVQTNELKNPFQDGERVRIKSEAPCRVSGETGIVSLYGWADFSLGKVTVKVPGISTMQLPFEYLESFPEGGEA